MADQITKQCANVKDDCHYWGASSYTEEAQAVEIGATGPKSSGFRFPAVTIPQGCTIVSAYLKLRTDDLMSWVNGAIKTIIKGEDIDNATDFYILYRVAPQNRNKTDASVAWDFTPSTDEGVEHTSPDVKTIIQEIIDRAGWVSGNALVLFVEDNGSSKDSFFESYDDIPSYSAKLVVTYTDIPAAKSKNARITGKRFPSSRSARIHGKTIGSSNRSARITGIRFPDSREARIHGGVEEDEAREARIRGGLTDNNERSVVILGGVSSDRNAVITGKFPAWYHPSWKYRIKLTIDHDKVDADLTNLPVLVKLTSSQLTFANAKSGGEDFRFVEDDHITLLTFERERHDQANSKGEYWVKIPSVSSSVDTIFYLYYGNSDAEDVEDPTNVWDSDAEAVYHMADGVNTQTIKDSTVNAKHGTKGVDTEPDEVEGQIALAQEFDGNDLIDCNDGLSIGTGPFSIQSYFKTPATIADAEIQFVLNRYYTVDTRFDIYCYGDSGKDYIRIYVRGDTNTVSGMLYEVTPDTWYTVHLVWDTTLHKVLVYVNGIPDVISDEDDDPGTIGAGDFVFGRQAGSAQRYLTSIVDESRFYSRILTPAWCKADANSILNTLLTYGAEQPVSSSRNARITGQLTTNSSRSARVTGQDTDNSSRDARITGQSVGSSRESKIHGQTTEISERDARIHGVTTINNERDARIHGQSTDISHKNRSAVITGKDTANNEREARIHGQDTDNSSREVRITGEPFVSSREARITGQDTDNSEREARITGQITTNDEREARIHGQASDQSNREARITGKDTFNSERLAKIHGQDTDNSSRNARITGQAVTSEREARIHGKTTSNSARDARIHGKSLINAERDARITGQDTSYSEREVRITGKPVTSERQAKIAGKDIANSEKDARITGEDTAQDDREARITGESVTSSREARITGEETDNSQRDAKIHGKSFINAEREARITGEDAGNSERLAKITGQIATNSEREARIKGQSTTQDTRDARIHGQTTANSLRNAKITGKATVESTRLARITGEPSYSERQAVITGTSTVISQRAAKILGGLGVSSERSARITGSGIYSGRNAVIIGTGEISERSAVIRGKTSINSNRWATIAGAGLGSERSANIVGAKCPWFEKAPVAWQSKDEVDWYHRDKKKFYRQSRKIKCD